MAQNLKVIRLLIERKLVCRVATVMMGSCCSWQTNANGGSAVLAGRQPAFSLIM